MLGAAHPLIALRESSVLYLQEEYRECLDLIEASPDIFDVDQFLGSRTEAAARAVRCCVALGDWSGAREWTSRGMSEAVSSGDNSGDREFREEDPYPTTAKLGFLAGGGWAAYEDGDVHEAKPTSILTHN